MGAGGAAMTVSGDAGGWFARAWAGASAWIRRRRDRADVQSEGSPTEAARPPEERDEAGRLVSAVFPVLADDGDNQPAHYPYRFR